MNAIKGTVKNGQVILSEPMNWPDGTELIIEPASVIGLTSRDEDEGPMDAEAIERQLALMDQIEPLIMTPEEEAEWQAARQAQKDFEKATFNDRADKLRRMWE